jgi:hypothetical protein
MQNYGRSFDPSRMDPADVVVAAFLSVIPEGNLLHLFLSSGPVRHHIATTHPPTFHHTIHHVLLLISYRFAPFF